MIFSKKINLRDLIILKEFSFNPFIHRIIEVLIRQNGHQEEVDLVKFLQLMKIFLYTTDVNVKKEFMFNVYKLPRGTQKEGDAIPLPVLRDILTKELFVRSQWEDV